MAFGLRWIRSPWWDGFWLLSGLPIGLVIMLTCPGKVFALACAIMILDTAHIVSPLLLAWSQPQLRAIVRREWGAHLLFPAIIVLLCLKLDMATILGLGFAWNVYHYGAQNFGVASL